MAAVKGRRADTMRVTAAAWSIGLAVSWNLANVGAAADTVAAHYNITLGAVGLFATVMFAGQLAFQLPMGRVVDRIGTRNAGLLALVLVIVPNLATTVADGLGLALALRAIVGIGIGMGFITGAAAVRAAGGASVAQGLYGGICMVGAGIGIAVVGWLTPNYGWTTPFTTAAAVAVVALPILFVAPGRERAKSHPPPSVASLLSDRRLTRYSVAQTVTFGFSVIIGNWAVPLLLAHGVSRTASASVGSLTLLGAFIGRPLGGLVSAQRPGMTKLLVAASMLSGGIGTVALATAGPVPVRLAGALLIGLSSGIPFGPIYDGVARMRSEAPALALSFVTLPAIAAILVGTPLVGWAFEAPGQGRLGFFVLAALWTAAAVALPEKWGMKAPVAAR